MSDSLAKIAMIQFGVRRSAAEFRGDSLQHVVDIRFGMRRAQEAEAARVEIAATSQKRGVQGAQSFVVRIFGKPGIGHYAVGEMEVEQRTEPGDAGRDAESAGEFCEPLARPLAKPTQVRCTALFQYTQHREAGRDAKWQAAESP